MNTRPYLYLKEFVKFTPVRDIYEWYKHLRTTVYLVAYPKCGRTWFRLMVAKAIKDAYQLQVPTSALMDVEQLTRQNRNLPWIRFVDERRQAYLTRPKDFRVDKKKFRDKRVVFLARDPRDVIVSLYFHRTQRMKNYDGEISSLIRDEHFGIKNYLHFLSEWHQANNEISEFLLIRYEDLQKDTHRQLSRAIEFIGLPKITDEIIQVAVTFADFDNMRAMERNGTFGPGLRPVKANDTSTYKTRRGKAGGYVDYLSDGDIGYIEAVMSAELPRFYGFSPCKDD